MSARFQSEFANTTTLHPVGGVALAICAAMVFVLPRRLLLLPFLALLLLIPASQRVAIGGLDFDLIRILVVCAMGRVLIKNEWKGLRFCGMDGLVLAATAVAVTIPLVRTMSTGPLIYLLGRAYDAVLLYGVLRVALQSRADLLMAARVMAVMSVPVCCAFALEWMTRYNIFSVFGGVKAITWIRDGRLRCQGPYAHPITAGVVWVGMLPMIASLIWLDAKRWWLGTVGAFCSLGIVYFCASSTPVFGAMVALGAGSLYKFRKYAVPAFWGSVAVLVVLHFVMKAPVWHLVSRVSAVGGSTGWHRYHLIDQAVNRIPEWFVMGTHGTAHWGRQLFDVTNHFIAMAVTGGILSLGLLVATLWVGMQWARQRAIAWEVSDPGGSKLAWALWTSMVAHSWMFIGVSYFGQAAFVLTMHLAAIAGLHLMRGAATAEADATTRSTPARRRPMYLQTRLRGQRGVTA
ncbi:MAG: hypothetical protein AAF823_09840 [Planctomycetota bacterium]